MPRTIEQQITEQWRRLVDAELTHDHANAAHCRDRIDALLDAMPRQREAPDALEPQPPTH